MVAIIFLFLKFEEWIKVIIGVIPMRIWLWLNLFQIHYSLKNDLLGINRGNTRRNYNSSGKSEQCTAHIEEVLGLRNLQAFTAWDRGIRIGKQGYLCLAPHRRWKINLLSTSGFVQGWNLPGNFAANCIDERPGRSIKRSGDKIIRDLHRTHQSRNRYNPW